MSDATTLQIARVLARLPDWVRHDLGAKDSTVRLRAEETLAAMIANALESVPQDGARD